MRGSMFIIHRKKSQGLKPQKAINDTISHLIKVEYQVKLAYILECTIERFYKNLKFVEKQS